MNESAIVIDESVDYTIATLLRKNNFNVFAIIDKNASISDVEVLSIANLQDALLITEDKDFGELVFRFQHSHKGVLLLRIFDFKSDEKAEIVLKVLVDYYDDLKNTFSVLDNEKLRIRK